MGCSSAPKINKWTSPVYRLFIVPDGISSENYVRLQNALVESNRFFIVDRNNGFNAVIGEQNLERISAPTRFDNREKYSRLGRLYGAGSLIIANAACHPHSNWVSMVIRCQLNLSLISTMTGEVVATAEDTADDENGLYEITYRGELVKGNPSWIGAVNKLNENIPKNLGQKIEYDEKMLNFREANREESIREDEKRQQGVDLKGGL